MDLNFKNVIQNMKNNTKNKQKTTKENSFHFLPLSISINN